MSKVKFVINNTKNLDIALTKWLEKYGFEDVYIIGLKSDFGYYASNCGISYSLLSTDTITKSWEHLMRELKCPYYIDPFYTSFLHELGHDQTLHLLEEDEIAYTEDAEKYLCNTEEVDIFEANMIYYHLPREIIATEWAIDFIKINPDAVKELIDTTQPAIKELMKGATFE